MLKLHMKNRTLTADSLRLAVDGDNDALLGSVPQSR